MLKDLKSLGYVVVRELPFGGLLLVNKEGTYRDEIQVFEFSWGGEVRFHTEKCNHTFCTIHSFEELKAYLDLKNPEHVKVEDMENEDNII
jgi:hypothetical protein